MESHSLVEGDNVPLERITVWKRSKSRHLYEMTKCFSSLDGSAQELSFYKRSSGAVVVNGRGMVIMSQLLEEKAIERDRSNHQVSSV